MEKQKDNDIRLFFYYTGIYSILALITTSFEGKDERQIVADYFLRCLYTFGIGLFSGLTQMAGMITAKEFHKWLKNKKK